MVLIGGAGPGRGGGAMGMEEEEEQAISRTHPPLIYNSQYYWDRPDGCCCSGLRFVFQKTVLTVE